MIYESDDRKDSHLKGIEMRIMRIGGEFPHSFHELIQVFLTDTHASVLGQEGKV